MLIECGHHAGEIVYTVWACLTISAKAMHNKRLESTLLAALTSVVNGRLVVAAAALLALFTLVVLALVVMTLFRLVSGR